MRVKSIIGSLVRAAKRPFYRRPRIVMTLLCRDEEDIVGYNIAYHLAQGVDFIVAMDNGSIDRTPALLERFARLGKLHLIHEPRHIHDQSTWVTGMARMAATRFDADWVINNDADEFWSAPGTSLRAALAAVPADVPSLSVPRIDMLPARDGDARFYEAMTIHMATRAAIDGGKSPPKACHRAFADIHIADGNHFASRGGARLPESAGHPLRILHFPIRSRAQLERKIRQGVAALAANPRLPASTGRHWRNLHRDYLTTGRLEDYYLEHAPSAERIAAGLARGALIEDTSVRDALRRLAPDLVEPGRGGARD